MATNKLETFNSRQEKTKETWRRKLLEKPFDELGIDGRKRRILLEQEHKCNKCGIDSWQGEPLTLELEHIDGVNSNHARENLECLCPNCHSLTKTWRGRNKNDDRKKVSDDDILKALLSEANIRQALLKVGLAAKGSNYGRAKKILVDNKVEKYGF